MSVGSAESRRIAGVSPAFVGRKNAGETPAIQILILLLWFCGILRADTPHTFEYRASPTSKTSSVNVAGTFNGWSTTATRMTDRGDGTYTATVSLPNGIYQYKFVINGKEWTADPLHSDKELEESDGSGGKNSAFFVGRDARKAPPPKPDAINPEFVIHEPGSAEDVNVASKHLLRLRMRAQAGDVDSVIVHFGNPDPGAKWKSVTMAKTGTVFGLDSFGACISTDDSVVNYVFLLTDHNTRKQLTPVGLESESAASFHVELKPEFETPDWAKRAVWYQIFPERFRNGDPSNDPGDKEFEHLVKWQADWWKTQPGEEPGDGNFYKGWGNVWRRRYGGDIQGLRWALPYLKSLGVNAIYLNPMFEADSMHKYDTSDYRHIDDNFGSRGDLAELKGETDDPATWLWSRSDKLFLDYVAEAHRQGFKVILDGVFNHVGKAHPFFQDVLQNGKSSKYASWFDVTDFESTPIKYNSWDGGGFLPTFKKDARLGLVHGPREHVLAIVKRWLAPDGDASRGVDGFRLDVPGDIPHPFWVDFRKAVKAAKPDAYISGEIWTAAQPWLQGDQFDAVMNYQFATFGQEFFVNDKRASAPSEFAQHCNEMIWNYPLQVSLVQMNLFDSHDTDRFASMFVNPDLRYDEANRIQDNGPKYDPKKPDARQRARMRQSVAFQMTFLGAPMIYYGDEAGMWGPDDPSNRQPMVWKDLEPYDNWEVKFDDELFKYYQRLISIRQRFAALSTGFFRVISTDDAAGVLVFARDLGDEHVYVALNRSPRSVKLTFDVEGGAVSNFFPTNARNPTDIGMMSSMEGRTRKLTVNLGPYDSAIFGPPTKKDN